MPDKPDPQTIATMTETMEQQFGDDSVAAARATQQYMEHKGSAENVVLWTAVVAALARRAPVLPIVRRIGD